MTLRPLAALCLVLSALAPAYAEPPAPAPSPKDCVQVSPTAPFVGYAYNHVVELTNGCKQPVSCEVWTDVDPTPRHRVALKSGESASILVRRGSPAREYRAESLCKF